MSQSEAILYCVICKMRGSNYVRVAGPFDTQQAAVEWAYGMRGANRLWDYIPEVMDRPVVEAAHA
jgi:hypothetical protein